MNELLQALANMATIVTAAGVVIAGWQIRQAKQQAVTQFEDNMAKEYRELAQKIPINALLGEDVSEQEYRESLDEFYHYIDLSNEQVFLRHENRVRANTWDNWRDGIKSNLSKPAFKKAWEEIKRRAPESFNELRKLEGGGFGEDPARFKTP